MKVEELKELDLNALYAKKLEFVRERFNLIMQHKTRRLQETHKLRAIRVKIAQVNTLLTQKVK